MLLCRVCVFFAPHPPTPLPSFLPHPCPWTTRGCRCRGGWRERGELQCRSEPDGDEWEQSDSSGRGTRNEGQRGGRRGVGPVERLRGQAKRGGGGQGARATSGDKRGVRGRARATSGNHSNKKTRAGPLAEEGSHGRRQQIRPNTPSAMASTGGQGARKDVKHEGRKVLLTAGISSRADVPTMEGQRLGQLCATTEATLQAPATLPRLRNSRLSKRWVSVLWAAVRAGVAARAPWSWGRRRSVTFPSGLLRH